jgi:hypothetical protein
LDTISLILSSSANFISPLVGGGTANFLPFVAFGFIAL